MKVSLITRHAITNYGSLLQAFATQAIIEKLGHKCEIINYIREDEKYSKRELTLLKRKPEWNNKKLKRIIYLFLRFPESILAGIKFGKEQKKYLNLSREFNDLEELKKYKPVADIYMTGSDQVWGPVENGTYDSAYCLSFTNNLDKKVAYAASFGRTDITNETCDYYKKWLSLYKYISVREDSAVDFLNMINIHSEQVLDPTLLLDSSFWGNLAKQKRKKKYILIYQLHNNPKLGNYAKKVAKELNLPLLRISTSLHQINREGKLVWCPTINEFLGYIQNTECLITDSFHGTAFAINFNITFVEVLPNNSTGTRNLSILKKTNLLDRILLDEDNTDIAKTKINYESVNKTLEHERRNSIDILKHMIEE